MSKAGYILELAGVRILDYLHSSNAEVVIGEGDHVEVVVPVESGESSDVADRLSKEGYEVKQEDIDSVRFVFRDKESMEMAVDELGLSVLKDYMS